MKKILLLIAAMLFITSSVIAQTTYTSVANGAWSSDATWSGSGTPGSSDTAVIDGEIVQVTSAVTVDRLTLSSGLLVVSAALTITNSSGNSAVTGGEMSLSDDLTISDGNFSNNGTITIASGKNLIFSSGTGDTFTNDGSLNLSSTSGTFSSVIFDGTYSADDNGNMSYSRYVEGLDGEWDLIGPPLHGQSIYSFIGANSDLASQTGTSERGIGIYDNSDGTWDTYSQADALLLSFTAGDGYEMATETGANIEFKGVLKSGTVTKAITYNETDPWAEDGGSRFNLVANPYASYINANTNAGGDCFLDANNLSMLDTGTHQAFYAWDGAANSGNGAYTTITNATAAKYMAPGQAFMVGSKSGGGTLSFTTAMQTTGTTDDFYTGDVMDPDDRAELFIGFNQGENEKHTEIYFINEGSDGVDPSYDGALMELGDNSIAIYSRTLDNDDGTDIAVNALAYSEMWDKVIPIGINAMAGEELTVSVTHKTTPADLKIYLEDAQEGTFTLINNEDFVLTPSSDLSGVGRFFIHTTESTLSGEEVNTSLLNAYKGVDNNYITIEGLATQASSTEVSLYNILGTKVMDTSLDNTTNTQMVSTNGLSTGIYVLKLVSGENQLTKKLIIK